MFQMLKKWFGQQTDQGEEHLELFNRLVHETWNSTRKPETPDGPNPASAQSNGDFNATSCAKE